MHAKNLQHLQHLQQLLNINNLRLHYSCFLPHICNRQTVVNVHSWQSRLFANALNDCSPWQMCDRYLRLSATQNPLYIKLLEVLLQMWQIFSQKENALTFASKRQDVWGKTPWRFFKRPWSVKKSSCCVHKKKKRDTLLQECPFSS